MRLLVVMLLVTACAKKDKAAAARANEDIVQMTVFADQMCACTNKECARAVDEARATWWNALVAKRGPSPSTQRYELETRFTQCLTKAMTAEPAGPPPPGSAIERGEVPASKQTADLVREALAWARTKNEAWRIANMRFAYVDREGLLDPTHGEMSISFGRVLVEKRRVGAPTRSTEHSCAGVSTFYGKWRIDYDKCADTIDYVPHCSVTTIWKRVHERHPTLDPDAIATVIFWAFKKTWIFELSDEPTKLSIREELPDDCELAVEAK